MAMGECTTVEIAINVGNTVEILLTIIAVCACPNIDFRLIVSIRWQCRVMKEA